MIVWTKCSYDAPELDWRILMAVYNSDSKTYNYVTGTLTEEEVEPWGGEYYGGHLETYTAYVDDNEEDVEDYCEADGEIYGTYVTHWSYINKPEEEIETTEQELESIITEDYDALITNTMLV